MRALCVLCAARIAPQTRRNLNNMMRWKKEKMGSSCRHWHRHTHAERERERSTLTALTYSHAQPEGGRKKKENRKTRATQGGGEQDMKPYFYECFILGGVERKRVLGAVLWVREALG